MKHMLRLQNGRGLCLLALVFVICFESRTVLAATPTYDNLGRLIQVDYADGSSVSYVLDSNGNPLDRIVIRPVELSVTVDPPGAGTVTGAGRFRPNTSTNLSATPAGGFLFDHWGEASASLGTSASLSLTIAAPRSLTAHFVPATSFNSWRQSTFGTAINSGESAETADPDGDGIPNLMEYAIGLDPKTAQNGVISVSAGQINQRGKPTVSTGSTSTGVDFRAVFGRRKDYDAAGLIYKVQFSGDLVTWVDSTATPTVIADDGIIEAVTVPYPFFAGTKKARFFRVSVSLSP